MLLAEQYFSILGLWSQRPFKIISTESMTFPWTCHAHHRLQLHGMWKTAPVVVLPGIRNILKLHPQIVLQPEARCADAGCLPPFWGVLLEWSSLGLVAQGKITKKVGSFLCGLLSFLGLEWVQAAGQMNSSEWAPLDSSAGPNGLSDNRHRPRSH